MIRALPAWCFIGVYAALAAAMLSICARTPGRRMHWFALAWGVGKQALQVAEASFAGTPARVVPFRCEGPAQASDAGRIAAYAAHPDR